MEPIYILAAELDAESFVWLDALRREHFPPERNLLAAHLTLFHRLTSAQAMLLAACGLPRAPVPILFDGPMLLGFGVAVRVRSSGLDNLRAAMKFALDGQVTRQDAQQWRPHVTIQNKVNSDDAKRLHRKLQDGFMPRAGQATALLLWEYLGGPWKLSERWPFCSSVAPSSSGPGRLSEAKDPSS